MEKKKIIVTGSNGFIGRNLVDALEKTGKYEVIGVDIPNYDIRKLQDLGIFEGADTVFHLATYPLINCVENPYCGIDTNIKGTLNVIKSCLDHKVRRLVYSSASSVYGNPKIVNVPEWHDKVPTSIYGVTKYAGEGLIHALMDGRSLDTTYTIFRFTNIYGPGQSNGLIPTVISKLKNNEIIKITGNGEQTRDFVYVGDVVDILIRSIESPLYSSTMNLGSNEEISVNDVVSMAARVLDVDYEIQYSPGDFERNRFKADTTLLYTAYPDVVFKPFSQGLYRTVQNYL